MEFYNYAHLIKMWNSVHIHLDICKFGNPANLSFVIMHTATVIRQYDGRRNHIALHIQLTPPPPLQHMGEQYSYD